jgi:cyanophycinase-like exopeptidase
MTGARLLAIMGSGETTPTMVKVHRQLFQRLGPSDAPAVVVGTPYGFQSNAADISARAVAYFRESVGEEVKVAPLARTEGAAQLSLEADLASIAESRWVFSGPGSPTYALRQWRPTVVPHLLAEKLHAGGCIVFSSAAALTLGRWTVPVYEIYKAGADPEWAEGLDLLGDFGLPVAVIPHFDNAEGGTHDTRYCYLGEQRLATMEALLPGEGWVLGVDEHTACIFDLSAGQVTVTGLGAVTVRRRGSSSVLPAGTSLSMDELLALAADVGARPGAAGAATPAPATSAPAEGSARGPAGVGEGPASVVTGFHPGEALEQLPGGQQAPGRRPDPLSPLLSEVARLTRAFGAAISERDHKAALATALETEQLVHDWSADTTQSDELDRARAALRRMVLRLGELAQAGLRDPREAVSPWVEALVAEREEARAGRRYLDADRIRERLAVAGVAVRDTAEGPAWDLRA